MKDPNAGIARDLQDLLRPSCGKCVVYMSPLINGCSGQQGGTNFKDQKMRDRTEELNRYSSVGCCAACVSSKQAEGAREKERAETERKKEKTRERGREGERQ